MSADFRKGKSLFATTSNSFSTGEGVTITPNDVSGLPTGNLVLTFDREVTGKVERIKGAISGSNFVVASGGRGYDGTTEQAHTSPNVEYIYNGADQNDAADAFVAEHSVAGLHDATKVAMLAGTQTVTGAKTFSAATTVSAVLTTSAGIKNTPRVVTTTDDATAVIDVDITDEYVLTAVANATVFTLTGTPVSGQKLIVSFKDAGVAKALTWTGFTNRGATAPTTTVAGKWHKVGCIYNAAASTMDVVAAIVES